MNRLNNKNILLTLSLTLLISITACSSKKDNPVLDLQQTQQQVQRPNGESADAIKAEVTLSKAEILSKTYLYGASLQSSSLMEDSYATALLSIALSHTPAKFKLVGDTLQISADQSINFESDVNHPDRLIQEFAVVRQDDNSITIKITKGILNM